MEESHCFSKSGATSEVFNSTGTEKLTSLLITNTKVRLYIYLSEGHKELENLTLNLKFYSLFV